MAKLYDAVVTTGTYLSNGETKYVTRNVGAVIETKNGLSLVMDASFNPAGARRTEDGKVWITLFEPREEDAPAPRSNPHTQPAQQTRRNNAPAPPADFDDDIPF